jgi:hypothetical protein
MNGLYDVWLSDGAMFIRNLIARGNALHKVVKLDHLEPHGRNLHGTLQQ